MSNKELHNDDLKLLREERQQVITCSRVHRNIDCYIVNRILCAFYLQITINTPLNASVTYVVTTQDWHQIRVQSGWIYGLRLSPESDGQKFALIVQNAIRSLQGNHDL